MIPKPRRFISTAEIDYAIHQAEMIWGNLDRGRKREILRPLHEHVGWMYTRVFLRLFDGYGSMHQTLIAEKPPTNNQLDNMFSVLKAAFREALEQDQKDKK